jgi:thiamine biosynthesis lipoprotein
MAPRLEIDARTVRLILIAFVLLTGLSIHRLWLVDVPLDADVLIVQGHTMGTTYELRVAGEGLTESLRLEIEVETTRRLEDVDRWMSNWNPESEISRFNTHRSTDPFPVSFETAEVIAFAIEVSKWSGGAFDVTVGPLVALWGFGSGARVGGPPTQEEIDALLQHTGLRILRVGRGNPSNGGFLRKKDPETEIDLSAIAKGYGVDHVAAGLFSLGREDFLVEIGGEIRSAGERPGGGPWRVAIEKPIDDGRVIHSIIELRDQAMATSGDYRIFYREDGRRISHTIDPRTGRPVEHGPASATAIATNATVADAWATTLMAMGEEGLQLAEYEGIAAMLLFREAEGSVLVQKNRLFPEAVKASDSHPQSP